MKEKVFLLKTIAAAPRSSSMNFEFEKAVLAASEKFLLQGRERLLLDQVLGSLFLLHEYSLTKILILF
jgi:hypothetical protein